MSPKDAELYRRCDEVLHYLWDPIGVRGQPDARNEYEDYLPQVFNLVRDGVDKQKVADYLLLVEREEMGMNEQPDRAREIVEALFRWRERLVESG
jgi:hypothetical protein